MQIFISIAWPVLIGILLASIYQINFFRVMDISADQDKAAFKVNFPKARKRDKIIVTILSAFVGAVFLTIRSFVAICAIIIFSLVLSNLYNHDHFNDNAIFIIIFVPLIVFLINFQEAYIIIKNQMTLD